MGAASSSRFSTLLRGLEARTLSPMAAPPIISARRGHAQVLSFHPVDTSGDT
jgi:hypothetical protein